MKLSVCVEALYNGKDFANSMSEIKSLGIDAVEFWSWWDKDIDKMNRARKELDMHISTFCTKMISLVDPSVRPEYISGLKESIAVAKTLGCKCLISQVGNEREGVSREDQHKSLVARLKECAPILENEDITLVIEPLNTTVDHAGYYLWESDEGAEVVHEVNSPKVRMLFDIYHQQIMEGDVIRRSTKHIDSIGHIHAAGNPGRHELDIGELNYRAIFAALDEAGYKGYIGLEYFPLQEAKIGLLPWIQK